MSCQNCMIIAFSILLLQHSVLAQRPSFAGSRPTDGHNQKDKYNSNNVNIGNRFGEESNATVASSQAAVTQLAFGAAQRPPMQNSGLPIVYPESSFVPLAATAPLPAAVQPAEFANRFGQADVAVAGNNSGNNAASASNTQRPPLPLPVDAHGDQELINQLSRLPQDQLPFWFLNYQAIEAHRNGSAGSVFSGGQASSRSTFAG